MARRFVQYVIGLFSLLVIAVTVGCGTGGTANLRVLNASPDEPQINVLVDSKTVNGGLAYLANTGYISMSAGPRHLQVEAVSSTTPIVDTGLSLDARTNTTVVVTGTTVIDAMVLTDRTTAVNSGTTLMRLVNAAPRSWKTY